MQKILSIIGNHGEKVKTLDGRTLARVCNEFGGFIPEGIEFSEGSEMLHRLWKRALFFKVYKRLGYLRSLREGIDK